MLICSIAEGHYSIQETILSSIYIIEILSLLRTSLRPGTRSIMRQILAINAAVILMDVALLGIEYASLFLFETILKGPLYSIKLKLEFATLSRLVKVVGGGQEKARDRTPSPVRNVSILSIDSAFRSRQAATKEVAQTGKE